MYSIKLACLRTTEPLFRTYEPSDHRTFRTETRQCRCRTYEPSESRTFGMKNLSDLRTFGLESSHRSTNTVPVHWEWITQWTRFRAIAKLETEAEDIRVSPLLYTMGTHSETLPNALRKFVRDEKQCQKSRESRQNKIAPTTSGTTVPSKRCRVLQMQKERTLLENL